MLLFDFNRAPNPRRTRMFIAEKGLDIQRVNVDLYGMEQLSPEFLAINPRGTVPVLQTDDGTCLTETVAICHYLEQLHPEPPLMGRTPLQQAEVLMWNNIVEQTGLAAVAEVLRNVSPGFRDRALPGRTDHQQLPGLVDRGLRRMDEFFDQMDARLEGRAGLATDDYTLADISLLAVTDFAVWVRYRPAQGRPSLARWYEKAAARPSAAA